MKLLIDAGNRRLKWALSRGDIDAGFDLGDRGVIATASAAGELESALAAAWAALDRPASVWASCVAGAAVADAIAAACRVWALQPVFIEAQPRQAGVVNSYANPRALGGDRWAALVAARHLHPRRAVIVVDAGTAVTVDALDADGVFRGGVILPGARGMVEALGRQTANLGGDGDGGDNAAALATALATGTQAAMSAGAWLAVTGGVDAAVARQLAALPDGGGDSTVLLTGGDAERIAAQLTAGVERAPDLVLRGVAVIAASRAAR